MESAVNPHIRVSLKHKGKLLLGAFRVRIGGAATGKQADVMNSDPSQSQASSAAMAMLMEMMGMGSGSGAKGGGNRSGGATDKANAELAGDRRGGASDPRGVEKTTGRETRPLPVEFREALQNYYKAIERITP